MSNPAVAMTVAQAHAFFKAAHAGQVDKQGRDYYEYHLVPVAASVAHLGDEAVIAALGHDYIEDVHDGDLDAGVTALQAEGTPQRSIDAIVSVTRLPGESYPDLITRSCADPLGVHIKLADNAINIESSPGLAVTDPQKAHSLLVKRYLPARDRLIEARLKHTLGLSPAEESPRRIEHRIQQRRVTTDGSTRWEDLMTLPADHDVQEARDNNAGLPRRIVRVAIFEAVAPVG